jgi:hypothetical protein
MHLPGHEASADTLQLASRTCASRAPAIGLRFGLIFPNWFVFSAFDLIAGLLRRAWSALEFAAHLATQFHELGLAPTLHRRCGRGLTVFTADQRNITLT